MTLNKIKTCIFSVRRTALSHLGFPQYGADEMDPLLYRKGIGIAMTGDKSKAELDRWCAELRERSGCRVDWHWMGGRGVIRCLPKDIDRVGSLIREEPYVLKRQRKDLNIR